MLSFSLFLSHFFARSAFDDAPLVPSILCRRHQCRREHIREGEEIAGGQDGEEEIDDGRDDGVETGGTKEEEIARRA